MNKKKAYIVKEIRVKGNTEETAAVFSIEEDAKIFCIIKNEKVLDYVYTYREIDRTGFRSYKYRPEGEEEDKVATINIDLLNI